MRIFIQGGPGEPLSLLSTIAHDLPRDQPIECVIVSIPGINTISTRHVAPGARLRTFFIHAGMLPDQRRTASPIEVQELGIDFTPLSYFDINKYLAGQDFALCLIQTSRPDSDGYCSLGVSIDFAPTVLPRSAKIFAELNSAMPAARHAPKVHVSRFDRTVESNRPLPSPADGQTIAEHVSIAKHIAGLINDGDCLQIGIGKLPSAVLSQLSGHRDLGLHSGMIIEGVRPLIERGVLNGARKTKDAHRHIAGIAFGSADFYAWAAQRDDVHFKDVGYTHDPRIMSQIDNLVSVNSALEIDLFGQINAESVDGRQVSGPGGLPDFMRGARLARGGRSIVALNATALAGSVSRIRPNFGPGAIVTASRTDTDYVVTEFGVAHLTGKSLHERAEALVSLAHPKFREELFTSWLKMLR